MLENEKLLLLSKKLEKNAEKIEQTKEKLTSLEAECQKIEYDRMQLIIGDYLPLIEELQLTPAELRELLTGSSPVDSAQNSVYESEVMEHEE